MKRTKKVLALVLCLALASAFVPAAFAAPVNLDDVLGEWETQRADPKLLDIVYMRVYKESGEYKVYLENAFPAVAQKLSSIYTWTARPDGTIYQSGGVWVDAPSAASNINLANEMVWGFDGTYIFGVDELGPFEPYYVRKSAPAPSPSVKVGDVIPFGGYDWRVLDVKDGKALIISDRTVGTKNYHEVNETVTWENCDLRKYLNGEFYNSFSAADRAKIAETKVVNNNNPWLGTNGGNDTNDKIFLLNIEEAVKYFGDSGQLTNRPTGANGRAVTSIDDEYNAARIAISWNSNTAVTWTLRSSGQSGGTVANVSEKGHISFGGGTVRVGSGGRHFRPAMWITVGASSGSLDSAAAWAVPHIESGLAKGFIPADIQGSYGANITRGEFCRMAVKWVEYALNKPIGVIVAERGLPERAGHTFSDTADASILAAYKLGVTGGSVAPADGKPGQFNPSGQITRQEAAVMITNTCKAIGANVSNPPAADFGDMSAAASWAHPGISFVRANGIMSGSGGNFNPTGLYTRQESITTFNNIKHNELPGR